MRAIPSALNGLIVGFTLAAVSTIVGPRPAPAADWQPDRTVLPIQMPARLRTE